MNLRQSIAQTLAYFDIFHCPLTREELYTYLWMPPQSMNFLQFAQELEKEKGNTIFETGESYYFFPGQSESVAQRERRVWYIEKKLKIAKRAAWFLRFVPFVKAFFVCNQIQVGITKKSDIDVLIIVEPGRLYITRLFVTLLLGIFRLRRGKKKITDRICLSFYVTNSALDFSNLKVGDEDIYFMYWLATLVPVYDPENYLQKIWDQNSWVLQSLPHVFQKIQISKEWQRKESTFSSFIKKVLTKILQGKVGEALEKKAKQLQLKHMATNTTSVQNIDSRVVISDTILKFHENDRRGRFQEEWKKKWQSFTL